MKSRICILLIVLIVSEVCQAQGPCTSPSISGKLIYENTQNTPLSASTVYLKNSIGIILDSVLTDQNGYYQFCNLASGNYKLTAKTNIPWGGVNATDALLTLKYFLGQTSFTPLQYQSGNVNGNTYINAVDALLILKRFTQMITSFPVGDWVFEEPSVQVSNNLSVVQDIHGLCTGDVDGSYVLFVQTFVTCGDTLTDERNMQKYPTVQIGNQCWMKKSLNYGVMVTSIVTPISHTECSNNGIIEKFCYNNDSSLCNIYGGLYTWNEIMNYDTLPSIQGICPNGWIIPSDDDWCLLAMTLDPNSNCNNINYPAVSAIAGGKLKDQGTATWLLPNSGGTNESGFTAIGSGNRAHKGSFGAFNTASGYWSSNKSSGTTAIYWGVNNTTSNFSRVSSPQNQGYLVRCLKQ
jgi:uncharacterized protein (TIGR02145 family)